MFVISLTGTETYEKTFSNELRNHFKLIIIDLGSKERTIQAPTLDSIMNELEKLRISLELNKIAVFGHSGTVLLALEYAKRYPNNISHLVLMAAGPKWWQYEDYKKKQKEYWSSAAKPSRKEILKLNHEKILAGEEFSKANAQEQLIMTMNAEAPRYAYDPRMEWNFLWENTTINTEFVYHVWNDVLKDVDQTPFLSGIVCPVFISMGKYDFQNPPTLWDGVIEKFPNCMLHIFEKSGHFPNFEEQDLFDKKLIEWIKNK